MEYNRVKCPKCNLEQTLEPKVTIRDEVKRYSLYDCSRCEHAWAETDFSPTIKEIKERKEVLASIVINTKTITTDEVKVNQRCRVYTEIDGVWLDVGNLTEKLPIDEGVWEHFQTYYPSQEAAEYEIKNAREYEKHMKFPRRVYKIQSDIRVIAMIGVYK